MKEIWIEEILEELRTKPTDSRWKKLCEDFIALTGREPLVGDLWPEMKEYDKGRYLRLIKMNREIPEVIAEDLIRLGLAAGGRKPRTIYVTDDGDDYLGLSSFMKELRGLK